MVEVLVLEDDPLLADIMAEALTDAGYQVAVASEGLAALAVAGEEEGLKLLVADVDLGPASLDGMTVAGEARRLLPDLSVIFVTGNPALLGDQPIDERSRQIFKPFANSELVAIVQTLIGPSVH